MNDPIVEEVRRIRDAYAARFHYDLDAIFHDIKEQESKGRHKFESGISCPAAPSPLLSPDSIPVMEVPPAAELER